MQYILHFLSPFSLGVRTRQERFSHVYVQLFLFIEGQMATMHSKKNCRNKRYTEILKFDSMANWFSIWPHFLQVLYFLLVSKISSLVLTSLGKYLLEGYVLWSSKVNFPLNLQACILTHNCSELESVLSSFSNIYSVCEWTLGALSLTDGL